MSRSPIGPLIGMIHLGPLPGSPRFTGDFDAVLDLATSDARTLVDAGFDALMVENFGDDPFFPDDVPAITVSAMTRAVTTVVNAAEGLPIGVNVLRNDALSAVSIAAATGAHFVRVNVLTGEMHTDQGPIVGRAAQVARLRSSLAPGVLVLADVFVKHAVPPAGLTVENAARDTWERGGSHGLVVTGVSTGAATPLDRVEAVRSAVPDAPLFTGSGATADTIADILTIADGAIVGTWLKFDGDVTAPVDPKRAADIVGATRSG